MYRAADGDTAGGGGDSRSTRGGGADSRSNGGGCAGLRDRGGGLGDGGGGWLVDAGGLPDDCGGRGLRVGGGGSGDGGGGPSKSGKGLSAIGEGLGDPSGGPSSSGSGVGVGAGACWLTPSTACPAGQSPGCVQSLTPSDELSPFDPQCLLARNICCTAGRRERSQAPRS